MVVRTTVVYPELAKSYMAQANNSRRDAIVCTGGSPVLRRAPGEGRGMWYAMLPAFPHTLSPRGRGSRGWPRNPVTDPARGNIRAFGLGPRPVEQWQLSSRRPVA